jgi:YD repeat-containing protein
MQRFFQLCSLVLFLCLPSLSHADVERYWTVAYGGAPPFFRTPLAACKNARPLDDVWETHGSNGLGDCWVRLSNGQTGVFSGVYGKTCTGVWRYFDDKRDCVALSPMPDNTKDTGPCKPCVGNPINPGNSNKWQRELDYAAAPPFGGLSLLRTYNSTPATLEASVTRSFGKRWIHKYDAALKEEPDQLLGIPAVSCWRRQDNNFVWCEWSANATFTLQTVSIARADGKRHIFNRAGQVWAGDADVNDRLTALTDGAGNITGWNYVAAQSDETERYDASGKLLSIRTRAGMAQQLTYSDGVTNDTTVGRLPVEAPACSRLHPGAVLPAGRLLCVTDNWGRQLQFEYDSQARIIKMVDPANSEYLYAYDGPSGGCLTPGSNNTTCTANNLTQVTYPDGKSKTYHYNEAARINGGALCPSTTALEIGFGSQPNQLTGIADENGVRLASWTYDCLGRTTSSQHTGGVDKVMLVYGTPDAAGMSTNTITHSVGNPASPLTTMRNFTFKKVLGVSKSLGIDGICVECGDTKTYTYDANGNIATRTDWNGNQTTYAYDLSRNLETRRVEASGTAQARTISTQWHPAYRLPSAIAEPQRLTTFSYDGNGNLLTKSEQATSDVTGAQAFNAAAVGTPRVWRYTYNDVGQVLTATDPLGNLSSYSYDDQGNLVAVTNAAGHVTTLSHYDAHGRVGRIVDPNGLITDLSYHPRGWLSAKTVGGETTGYEYDGVGQLTKATLPDGSSLTYTYDDAHRLTDIADSLGNRIAYTLDLTGNRIKEQVTDPTGTLVRQTTRVYDALNRLQKITGGQP